MTNKEAANELKNYHREDGTVPEEIILAIKVLEERPTGEWIPVTTRRMTTKFNVGDVVLLKGVVESIYVESTDNKPIYHVRIKGAGTHEAYGIRVKEDVINCREVKNSEVKKNEKEC